MRRTGSLLVSAALLVAATGRAASGPGGEDAVDFLREGMGARAAALGDASGALVVSADSLSWNPAVLSLLTKIDATFSRVAQVKGISLDSAAYAQPAPGGRAWGVGLQTLSWGNVEETDESGNSVGNLSPRDTVLSAGFAFPMGPFAAGTAVKYVHSTLAGTAQTAAADLGVLSPPLWENRLRAGLAVTNLGGRLKFDEQSFPLPLVARASISLRPSPSWSMECGGGATRRGFPFASAGLEVRLPVGLGNLLTQRVGIVAGRGQSLDGPSLGLGWERRDLAVDYAYQPLPNGWCRHLIELEVRFRTRPDTFRLKRLMADAVSLREKGSLYEAALKYNEALALDPDNEEARRGLRDSVAEAARREASP